MKKLISWIITGVKLRLHTRKIIERLEDQLAGQQNEELWIAQTDLEIAQTNLEYERSKVVMLELELRHVWLQYQQCSGWLEEERKLEEHLRCQKAEAYWDERDEARFAAYDQEEEEDEGTVEDFSEHPSLSAEDDAVPPSPEMEFWFTRCDKCRQYPEFCQCSDQSEY